MKPLGVGLVYWPPLDPLIDRAGEAISVLELEPEGLWEKISDGRGGWQYRENTSVLDRLASLTHAKLLHGVAHPFAGTTPDPIDPWALLPHAVERLELWVSEHLSFNRVLRDGDVEHAGFLLPPPQTPAAVRVAAHNIDAYRRALARPVAFETGVNYLRPNDGELGDGSFFAMVSQGADCGILLDLHNVWCNERNGRRRAAEVLDCLPLDRVWELHLAGGMDDFGFRLDAHSGLVPPEVIDIAAEVIPRLPRLGALIFEILPEHVPLVGLDGIERQLEDMWQLWSLRHPLEVSAAGCMGERAPNVIASADDMAEVAGVEAELVGRLRTAGRSA